MNSEQAPLSPAPPLIESGSVISGTFTAFISMDSILIILCLPIISQWVKIIRAAAEYILILQPRSVGSTVVVYHYHKWLGNERQG